MFTEEELKDIEEWYTDGLLAWHDKGETAEEDVPRLIQYIKELQEKISKLESK